MIFISNIHISISIPYKSFANITLLAKHTGCRVQGTGCRGYIWINGELLSEGAFSSILISIFVATAFFHTLTMCYMQQCRANSLSDPQRQPSLSTLRTPCNMQLFTLINTSPISLYKQTSTQFYQIFIYNQYSMLFRVINQFFRSTD